MTAATRPWRAFGLLLVLGLGLGVLPFARFVPDALATDPSVVVPEIRPLEPAHAPLTRQVYGYLPWWQLGPDTAGQLQYDLLTTIAFFGIGIQRDGDLDRKSFGYFGYVSGNATAVTNAAHDHGVRVVPTFQLFDSGRLPDLKFFLAHTAAQKRFISQAIALMVSRGADGANLDLEPLPDSLGTWAAQFVGRFRSALRARMPGATLVVAMPAGASGTTIEGLVPLVDQLFIMAYDYRTVASSKAGPVAPLDGPSLSVQNDLARYLRHAPPGKLILGMPAYGYDWPVTSRAAEALVRDDTAKYGSPFAVTFSRVSGWLADHPSIPVRYDPVSGSPYFTYHDHDHDTYRQVWFEDDFSLGRKVDLALTSGLSGVGLWALDGNAAFDPLWQLLHDKLAAPTHRVVVRGSVFHLAQRAGSVEADIAANVLNRGTVPETGQVGWAIRDGSGHLVASGSERMTVASHGARRPVIHVVIGTARKLAAGTYRLTLVFGAGGRHWAAPAITFKQKF